MSHKELDRLPVCRSLQEGTISQKEAAVRLGVTERHLRRIQAKYAEKGVAGLIHQGRGKRSNNRIAEDVRDDIEKHVTERYEGVSTTLIHEKLKEGHEIQISLSSVRTILIEKKLWKPRKERNLVHRTRRERRAFYGEMILYDGCDHDWFEGRAPRCSLLVGIDDASNQVPYLRFDTDEGVAPTARYWSGYLEKHGKPGVIYLDRFSTYKVNSKEKADDPSAKTQFEKACEALNITVIHAQSPQAKGRVERVIQTLQKRLPLELRLADINTVDEANCFLVETFIPAFNAKFAVVAREEGDAHRPLLPEEKTDLMRIFAAKTERTVHNDFTIKHKGVWYQIKRTEGVVVRSGDTVVVEDWMDGTMHVAKQKSLFLFEALPAKPEKVQKVTAPKPRVPHKPAANHPWRKH